LVKAGGIGGAPREWEKKRKQKKKHFVPHGRKGGKARGLGGGKGGAARQKKGGELITWKSGYGAVTLEKVYLFFERGRKGKVDCLVRVGFLIRGGGAEILLFW